MPSAARLQELDERIALARRSIQNLTEEAASASGAGTEESIAERLSLQQERLDALIAERDSLDESEPG